MFRARSHYGVSLYTRVFEQEKQNGNRKNCSRQDDDNILQQRHTSAEKCFKEDCIHLFLVPCPSVKTCHGHWITNPSCNRQGTRSTHPPPKRMYCGVCKRWGQHEKADDNHGARPQPLTRTTISTSSLPPPVCFVLSTCVCVLVQATIERAGDRPDLSPHTHNNSPLLPATPCVFCSLHLRVFVSAGDHHGAGRQPLRGRGLFPQYPLPSGLPV